MTRGPQWIDFAACRGEPVDLWLVSQRGRVLDLRGPEYCERCPVRVQCLVDGWWDPQVIRGQLTPLERQAVSHLVESPRRRQVAA